MPIKTSSHIHSNITKPKQIDQPKSTPKETKATKRPRTEINKKDTFFRMNKIPFFKTHKPAIES